MSNPELPPAKSAGDMPLVAHLTGCARALLRIVLVWLLIFAGLFYFANDIYAFISEPLRALMPPGSMIATDVASPFVTFKLTLVGALFIAMPFVLHQIWGFIAPGLYGMAIAIRCWCQHPAVLRRHGVRVLWSFRWCSASSPAPRRMAWR